MTAIPPPLTLSVANAAGVPVLTIGDGLPINVLTVRLANNTGQPLSLRGGKPAPDDRPDPAAASALSFNFGALLQKTQYDAITISATRWTARQLGALPAWTVAPDADVMLAAGESLTFTITGLNVPVAPSGHLTIDYANFGIAGNGNVRAPLDCRPPPLTGAPMALSPSPSWIVADGQPNTLVLRVENTTSPLTSIGTSSWDEVDAPKFSLLFVYDPEDPFALTTADSAEDIDVRPSGWTGNPRPSTGDAPVWTLRPATPPVLGADPATLRETITVSNIVSRLPPGKARITLQWSQIPGYANGEATTYIDKIAPLAITGLRCDPAWTLAGAPIHPTVHWDPVSGSPTSLELVGPDGRYVVDVTDTSHEYPTALSQPTTLTLHAEGPGGRQTEEHTALDAVVFQTKLAVPLGQDGDQKAIVRRSYRWDVVYVGCFDDMGEVLNSAAYRIQIRDGTNGSRLAAIDASWSAKQNPVGMWQSPPVADGIDRLAVVGYAEIQIWDIGESHSATRRATIPTAGGSRFLGFLPDGDLLIGTLNPDPSVELMSGTLEMVRHDPLGSRPAVTVRTLTLDGPALNLVLTLDAESLLSIVWKGVPDPNLKNPDEYYKQVAPIVVRKTRISDGVLVDEVSLGQWYLLGISEFGITVLLAPAVDGSAWLLFRDSMTDLGLAPLPFGNNAPELVHFPLDGSGKATAHTIPEVASAPTNTTFASQASPNGNDLVIPAAGLLYIAPISQPTAGVVLKLGDPYTVEFSSGGDRLTLAVTDSNNVLANSIVELSRTVVSPPPEEAR